MLWIKELFGVKKSLIAMFQLDAPPCDILYRRDNDMILRELHMCHPHQRILGRCKGNLVDAVKQGEVIFHG